MTDSETEALAERIRFVMSWKGLTASAWASKAGYSRNVLNTFFSRLQKNKAKALRAQLLYDLAVAADVNPLWLMVGKGAPSPPQSEADSSPWRTLVATMALAEGVPRTIVAKLDDLPIPDDDGPFYWFSQLSRLRESPNPEPHTTKLFQLRSGNDKDA